MERLLIFSHFNPYNDLSSYVLYILKKMKPFFRRVVFVSNSELKEKDKEQIQLNCNKILIRENLGFDFGAWKDALIEEGWETLISYDSLILMNDTCFGPINDMHQVFDKMEIPDIDFWGLTNHRECKKGMPGSGGLIPEHIQSYFLCFNKKVVISPVFQEFWRKLTYKTAVNDVISQYETQLSEILFRSGFKFKVLLDTKSLTSKEYDFSTWHPDILIHKGIPFVKVKGFLYFNHPRYLKQLIENYSDYPVCLIDEHLNKTFNPNVSIKILNKNLIISSNKKTLKRIKASIAVHLHVFYIDIFEKIFHHLENTGVEFDLFITTDSQTKKEKVITILQEQNNEHLLKEIIIFENRGRNIFPWLEMSEKLEKYDIVGHFHTKKTDWADKWIGDSWLDDIIYSLIDPIVEIIEYFENHDEIGIVIPDIPYCYSLTPEVDTWGGNQTIFKSIWTKLNCKKLINVDELSFPIMPYGNMFWYRPNALKPLFDLQLSIDDFSKEPLPIDGTVAHSIERMPVYVAWSQGYDFRITLNNKNALSGFDFKIANDRLKKELSSIYQSYTWRIGRIFTFIPRKVIALLILFKFSR